MRLLKLLIGFALLVYSFYAPMHYNVFVGLLAGFIIGYNLNELFNRNKY